MIFESVKARLTRNVEIVGECWLWKGHTQRNGYGTIKVDGKTQLVHRVSYEVNIGPSADGLFVCHRCDIPLCIRPDHLFTGTAQENTLDSVKKGRWSFGTRNGKYTHPERTPRGNRHGAYTKPEKRPHGESHGGAKLTAVQVAEIRRRYAVGNITQKALAEDYPVGKSEIQFILSGKAWKE